MRKDDLESDIEIRKDHLFLSAYKRYHAEMSKREGDETSNGTGVLYLNIL